MAALAQVRRIASAFTVHPLVLALRPITATLGIFSAEELVQDRDGHNPDHEVDE
jgi:hypothetical protein